MTADDLTFHGSSRKPYYRFKDILLYKGDVLEIGNFDFEFFDLGITSPPYNVGVTYNSFEDALDYEAYLDFCRLWLRNCYFWAKDRARFCLNVPLDINKGGQRSIGSDITSIAKDVGWRYHSTIIWNEGNVSKRTAWGSWLSASAPYVISPVELIIVLYKNRWKKKIRGESSIDRDDFIAWTNGLWTFNGASKKIGHPAPFPRELPRRCIKLFSFMGDVVFDPFCGSGTTLLESLANMRVGVGLEIDEKYCQLIQNRIEQERGLF